MPMVSGKGLSKSQAWGLVAVLAATTGLGACQKGASIDDPAALKASVIKRANELGSSQVAQLTISGGGKRKMATSGMLTVRKSDGAAVTKPLEGEGSGMTSTWSPGLPADALPYEDLYAAYKQAKEQCGDDGASASVVATLTGKAFITANCLDINARPVKQLLDGKETKISSLTTPQDLETIINDAKILLGTDLTSFRVSVKPTLDSVKPHVAATSAKVTAGGQTCAPDFLRSLESGIQLQVDCSDPGTNQTGKADLSKVTGQQFSDALVKAAKELGVSGPAEITSASLVAVDGAQALEVLSEEKMKSVRVPLG